MDFDQMEVLDTSLEDLALNPEDEVVLHDRFNEMENLMKSTAIAKKLQEAMGSSVSVWRGISGEPTGMVYIEGLKSMTDYGKSIDGANSSDDFTKWANDALNDPSGVIGVQTLVRNMKSMV